MGVPKNWGVKKLTIFNQHHVVFRKRWEIWPQLLWSANRVTPVKGSFKKDVRKKGEGGQWKCGQKWTRGRGMLTLCGHPHFKPKHSMPDGQARATELSIWCMSLCHFSRCRWHRLMSCLIASIHGRVLYSVWLQLLDTDRPANDDGLPVVRNLFDWLHPPLLTQIN